ncbi:hypothetical protein WN66_05361 [Saccharomyces cerevisiae]|nr:hypothetical protein WN66_05361 [Saccharomyces cerevisiae]
MALEFLAATRGMDNLVMSCSVTLLFSSSLSFVLAIKNLTKSSFVVSKDKLPIQTPYLFSSFFFFFTTSPDSSPVGVLVVDSSPWASFSEAPDFFFSASSLYSSIDLGSILYFAFNSSRVTLPLLKRRFCFFDRGMELFRSISISSSAFLFFVGSSKAFLTCSSLSFFVTASSFDSSVSDILSQIIESCWV